MKAILNAQDIFFILVRPVYLGNIGSIARLVKNFGFSNLRLVEAPRNYKDAEARKMAVGAFDILKTSRVFNTLNEAIEDINIVIGTSTGQQRSQPLVPLSQAVEQTVALGKSNKVAIVFGDERNGLSNEELGYCQILMRIETNLDFPSLNVSQAAGIIAYEFSKLCGASPAGIQSPDGVENRTAILLPTGKLNEELFEQVENLLDHIDFSRKFNKTIVTKELRRFYYKAAPTKREADLLRGVLHKLNHALSNQHQIASADPLD
jgi:TrmH family RNA methyltransferase